MATRFSLRTALAWMAVSAVILTLLVLGNVWSWSALSTLTMFLLACAIPIALISGGSTRAFWLGFGVAGWFFYFLVHDALGYLNLHSNMLITKHIRYAIEFSAESERRGYIRLSADELSVLMFAVLAGFACRWVFNRQSASKK